MRQQVIEHAVIEAIRAAVVDKSVEVTRTTEVLQVLDSLSLMTALANVQGALEVALDADHLLEIFRCRYVAEVVSIVENVMSEAANNEQR